jgi:hypothetical protein
VVSSNGCGRISTARNATFQVRTLSETGTAFRAPNASEYMPLLDLSDSNPTGQPLWGVDVLSLPILRCVMHPGADPDRILN